MINSKKTNMKKNKQDYLKEKMELKVTRTKQLLVFIIMTLIAFIVFITLLGFIVLSFKESFN
jgi:t-SNARE complex subunit (syntaxin)